MDALPRARAKEDVMAEAFPVEEAPESGGQVNVTIVERQG
jgi:hypothetical protein